MRFHCLAVVLILVAAPAMAQEKGTANTLKLLPGSGPAHGSISDAKWLAGHWTGAAFGGTAEEIWSPPRGGVMMCAYRLVRDGRPIFYELITLGEESGSLIIRLKHFHPDLKGWEDKDQVTEFRLVAQRDGLLQFDGMTFRRDSKDALTVFLAIGAKDGAIHEEKFRYIRVKADNPDLR